MVPKIICTQCGAALTRTDEVCPLCGASVDWSDTGIAAGTVLGKEIPKKEIRENKSQRNNKSSVWPSKPILGAFAVLVLAIVVYAVMNEKQPGSDSVKQQAGQTLSAPAEMPADIQELENSVAANPDNMSLTLQLANSFHDRLFYDKAIPYYKSYLTMNPKDADARVDMGICYKETGNFSEAEKEMKTALQYAPNHLYAHFNLGIVYLSEGNLEESNVWLKKTVALDPKSEVGKRAQQLLTQHNSHPIKQTP